MKNYKNYTKEEFIKIVEESFSIAEVLRKLNLKAAGGNYSTFHLLCSKYEIDTSHFLGEAINRNKQLKEYKDYKKNRNLKINLIKERGHLCENCKRNSWQNKPIPLELEHIDGCSYNNSLDNLLLLCPNCHAQTKTWRRRKSSLL